MALPKWLEILKQVGPIVLMFTPLAKLVPSIVAGIAAAEGLPGASGPEKKALVQQIVAAGVAGANAQAGREVIAPDEATAAASAAIDTIVTVTNIVSKAHPADPPPPAVATT